MTCTNRCLFSFAAWLLIGAVAPAAPMKALIVDGQHNHPWKATTPILKQQLEETGLFTVDVATTPPEGTNMAGFHPDFAAYRLVVMNYSGDEWPEPTKRSFESYVSQGGGLVIVHAADNSFPNWKAYNEMAGLGGWNGRNEKDGPYVYWKDGKIVRDMTPGHAGDARRTAADPDRGPRQGTPDHKGLAREIPSRGRRVVRQAARAGQEPHGAGHRVLQSGHRRQRPRGADADDHRLRQGPSLSYRLGPRRQADADASRSSRRFQRGAEWAATGNVTQTVPADFPGPDHLSVRPSRVGTTCALADGCIGDGRFNPGVQPWVVYEGGDGPGKGKHVVLVSGDDEYRSEELLPQLGKILAKRHGFKCTVLFAIDPATGTINPKIPTTSRASKPSGRPT